MLKVYLIRGCDLENVDLPSMTLEELQEVAKRQSEELEIQTEFDLTEFQEYFNKGGTDSSIEYVRFVSM